MPKENVPIFEICGPVMIGPSSSHTAGVARIAFLTRKMFGENPSKAIIRFYGSLASTWKGHGSGDAAIAGLLAIPPEDERLSRGAVILAEELSRGQAFPITIEAVQELPPSWHPNSMIIILEGPGDTGTGGRRLKVRASSIGGGSIRIDEINGYQVSLSGELEALLVRHHDEIGVIAIVSHILAAEKINIAGTSSHRKEKGDEALLVVETDTPIPKSVAERIEGLPPIYEVLRIPSLGGL